MSLRRKKDFNAKDKVISFSVSIGEKSQIKSGEKN
jgi:hypothetical protein